MLDFNDFPLILASTSPRRQELLTKLGYPFTIILAEIDEGIDDDEPPHDYIMRMVRSKAQRAVDDIKQGVIITADTIGVINGQILTKPTDKAHAFAMWELLSDNTHEIWTAVAMSVVKDGQIIQQKTLKVSTEVTFIKLTEQMKERYWRTGEPCDKAGAYAIQGGAMAWVRAINGSYTSVVGLPLSEVAELLDEMVV